MLVYRLTSAKYTTLDGEGSRRYGGRWNSPGIPVVYTASSVSLAMLETRVHTRSLPKNYVRLTIEIPDAAFAPKELLPSDLIPDWKADLAGTRRIGDLHFNAFPMVALRTPSVVVDAEFNLFVLPGIRPNLRKDSGQQANIV